MGPVSMDWEDFDGQRGAFGCCAGPGEFNRIPPAAHRCSPALRARPGEAPGHRLLLLPLGCGGSSLHKVLLF